MINLNPDDLRTQAERTRDGIREAVGELDTLDLETGPWEGTSVVKLDDVRGTLIGSIPEASRHATEVRTPARVVATAVCPRCRQTGLITVMLSTELRVDDSGAELRVKGSSKAAPHTCGQIALEDSPDFDIGDIVGPEQEWSAILAELGYDVPEDVVLGWTLEQQAVVATWIQLQRVAIDAAADPERTEAIPFPAVPAELVDYTATDETEDDDAAE